MGLTFRFKNYNFNHYVLIIMNDDKEQEGCDCGSCPGCGVDDADTTPKEKKEGDEDEDAE